MPWPDSRDALIEAQERLARREEPLWRPPAAPDPVAGCFVCFLLAGPGRGEAGERGWAAAALLRGGETVATRVVAGEAGAPYEVGLLALRAGPLLEAAVRALPERPQALLVNATGRDHPRRAGLALQLGASVDIPTVGVTHRPLIATGTWPADDARGATAPLLLDDAVVGHWLRTAARHRPLAVHAAWRTDPATAVAVVLSVTGSARTPEPLRQARRVARTARARALRSPQRRTTAARAKRGGS